VHEALGAEMAEIHALVLKTWTHEQHLAKQARG
jgi:stress-induced morphogen